MGVLLSVICICKDVRLY